jgi:hypothetical protein
VITVVVAIPFGASGSSSDDASGLWLIIAAGLCTASVLGHDVPRGRTERPVTAAPPTSGPTRALAPEIERYLSEGRRAEARIREAIDRAQLSYAEVSQEIDSLLTVMQRSAQRAQMLHEALDDTPVARVEARLAELQGTAAGASSSMRSSTSWRFSGGWRASSIGSRTRWSGSSSTRNRPGQRPQCFGIRRRRQPASFG